MESTNASRAEFLAAREPSRPSDIGVWRLLRGERIDLMDRWTKIRREHGPVARYRYGLFDTFFVSSAEGVKRTLQDNPGNYDKQHPTYRMLKRLLGEGLLTSEGSFWLRQRRLSQPAFHKHRISAWGALMTAAAMETVEGWEARAETGEPVSLLNEMSRVTLTVVGNALFGSELSAKSAPVAAAWNVLNTQMTDRFRRLRLLPPILPTRYDRSFREARRTMFRVVDEIIADKREKGADTEDLLSMLMAAQDEETGERMTNAQLRDEVVTMLLAGHETTAVTLAWAWVTLAQHPAAARTMHAELDRVLCGRVPRAEDLPQLKYTRSVVEETMRLYPPAYIINRHIRADDVLSGVRVYKGGSLVLSPLILHRHPDYWEAPDSFRPERWLDADAEKKRPRFAYMPFGGGPRQCIGNSFAMMEAVLILATLAQRFEAVFSPGYEATPEFLVLMRPLGGAPAALRRRSPPSAHASSAAGASTAASLPAPDRRP